MLSPRSSPQQGPGSTGFKTHSHLHVSAGVGVIDKAGAPAGGMQVDGRSVGPILEDRSAIDASRQEQSAIVPRSEESDLIPLRHRIELGDVFRCGGGGLHDGKGGGEKDGKSVHGHCGFELGRVVSRPLKRKFGEKDARDSRLSVFSGERTPVRPSPSLYSGATLRRNTR